MVAVLLSVPVPVTVAVTVKVTLPPLGISTVVLMLPVPDAVHAAPALGAQLHVAPVNCAGSTSTSVAPVTSLGPLLLATIV
jgi:hypothetical protein